MGPVACGTFRITYDYLAHSAGWLPICHKWKLSPMAHPRASLTLQPPLHVDDH
jgi:hypothetical protein